MLRDYNQWQEEDDSIFGEKMWVGELGVRDGMSRKKVMNS
jgi:hypothetical protein